MSLPVVSYIEPRISSSETGHVYAGFVNFKDGNRLTFHNEDGIQKETGGLPVKEEYISAAEDALNQALAAGEFTLAPARPTS